MISRQAKAVLFAVLLFFGGAVAGALADRYYAIRTVHARPSADTMRKMYVTEMKSRLHLSDAQVSSLNGILDQTHAKLRAFRDSHRVEFEHINQEQIGSVRAILTPEQIPAYERLIAEREEHRKQHQREP